MLGQPLQPSNIGEWESAKVSKAAGVRRISIHELDVASCHPHRFRDTFAVSLLLKGVSLDSVSKLLGHSSIKITERH